MLGYILRKTCMFETSVIKKCLNGKKKNSDNVYATYPNAFELD